MTAPVGQPAEEPVDVRALLAARERARSEIARWSGERDRGSGERTGRLANLGAWEAELARIEAALARTEAGPPPEGNAPRG
ncbi:MAG: hypothetical protein WD734_06915 [Dehalococcoidia bacterium]